MKHIIELPSGKIELEDKDNHVFIRTERLNVGNITAFIDTVWADCDLAVSVNGRWLKDAFTAGQHRDPGNLED